MSLADLIAAILIWTAILVGASLLLLGYVGIGLFGADPSTRQPLWLGGGLIVAAVLTLIARSRRGATSD